MEPNANRKSKLFRIGGSRGSALIAALISLTLIKCVVYLVPIDLLNLFGTRELNRINLISYAPEVWLSLLALVFGTLIIVISIASESTPKLIDLFVGDYKSRLFIWLITLSSLENIFLQLVHAQQTFFLDNLIFLNSYILLPGFVLISIPYIFYILKYTKNSNVIEKIYDENKRMIREARDTKGSKIDINQNQYDLFETVNQLHDILQHVRFKEPKGDVIHKFGRSLRFYLNRKKTFSDEYFVLGNNIKKDISFRTLTEKFPQVERERTFYEHKVLRIFGTSYLLLMRDGHYDLASLCGNELCETGKVAAELGDTHAVSAVLLHFNTLLRHGINHGLRTKEIKNVYNTIFHYSLLVEFLIKRNEIDRIVECTKYFGFYGNEVSRLADSEPFFNFLVDAFATELKKILIALFTGKFPRELQSNILKTFNELNLHSDRGVAQVRGGNNGFRLIQIGLCLFYIENDEHQFNELTVDAIIRDLGKIEEHAAKGIITIACNRLRESNEEFWEDTDQGNRNIFYTHNKEQLSKFHSYFLFKLANTIYS